MNWTQLTSISQLGNLDLESQSGTVLILKHSSRCSISAMALDRLERKWKNEIPIKPYFLDLLAHRDVSNAIESRYGVMHESPQVLLIRNGQCVYHASHSGIVYENLTEQVN